MGQRKRLRRLKKWNVKVDSYTTWVSGIGVQWTEPLPQKSGKVKSKYRLKRGAEHKPQEKKEEEEKKRKWNADIAYPAKHVVESGKETATRT